MPVIVVGLGTEKQVSKSTLHTLACSRKAYHREIGVHGVELKVNLFVDSRFTVFVVQLPHVACHFSLFFVQALDVEDGLLKRKVEVTKVTFLSLEGVRNIRADTATARYN